MSYIFWKLLFWRLIWASKKTFLSILLANTVGRICKLDLTLRLRMFGPKTAIFAPKYAFLSTYSPCWLIWCPVGCGSGCGAWAVFCNTPIYFIYLMPKKNYNLQLLIQNWNIAINFEALRPFFKCRKLHGFCRNCFASKTGLGIFLWQISWLRVHIR